MISKLTVINLETGEQLVLEPRSPEKSGFLITSVQGLGPVKATVATQDKTVGDGSTFGGSRVSQRNIVLSLTLIDPNYANLSIQALRMRSYRFFPIKRKVGIIIENEKPGRDGYIEGYVESNEPDIFSKQESIQVSIICPDPYFYKYSGDPSDPVDVNGIALDGRTDITARTVSYNGDSPVGLSIHIDAHDDIPVTVENKVVRGIANPRIRNTTHSESIRVNTADNVYNINDYKWEKKLKASLDAMLLKDEQYVVGTESEFKKELKEFGLNKYISTDFWKMYNTAVVYVLSKTERLGPFMGEDYLYQTYYPWVVPLYNAIDSALKSDIYYHIGTFTEFRKDLKSWGFELGDYNAETEQKMYASALYYYWQKLYPDDKVEDNWHWWEPIVDEYISIEKKAKRLYADFPSKFKKGLSREFGLSPSMYTNAEFSAMYRRYAVGMIRTSDGRYWTYQHYPWESALEKAINRSHSKKSDFKFTGITDFFEYLKETKVINEKEYANVKPSSDPTIRDMFRYAVWYNYNRYNQRMELPSSESSKWSITEDGTTTNYLRTGLRLYLSRTDPNFKPYSYKNLMETLRYSPHGGSKVAWEDITSTDTKYAVCQFAICTWHEYFAFTDYNPQNPPTTFIFRFFLETVPAYRKLVYNLATPSAGGDPTYVLPQYKNTAEESKCPFRKFLKKHGFLYVMSGNMKTRRLSDDLILYLYQIGIDYLAGRPLRQDWQSRLETQLMADFFADADSTKHYPMVDFKLGTYSEFYTDYVVQIAAPVFLIGADISVDYTTDYYTNQGIISFAEESAEDDPYHQNQSSLEPNQGGVYLDIPYEEGFAAYQWAIAYVEKIRAYKCRIIDTISTGINGLGMQKYSQFFVRLANHISALLVQEPLMVFPEDKAQIDAAIADAEVGTETVYDYPVEMYYYFVQYGISSWFTLAPTTQMMSGDHIIIQTSVGNREVRFIRYSTAEEDTITVDMNALPWVENWRKLKWPMLHVGDNRLVLDADTGIEDLKASITWPTLFDGM